MSREAEQPIDPPEGPTYCPNCGSYLHRFCDPDAVHDLERERAMWEKK